MGLRQIMSLLLFMLATLKVAGEQKQYTAQFRSLGKVATGSSMAHLKVPLDIPNIILTYTRTYQALDKAIELSKKHSSPVTTRLELISNPIIEEDNQGNSVLLHFDCPPYLILDDRLGVATELTQSDLSLCRSHGDVKYCPNIMVQTRRPKNNCLFSLFMDADPLKKCNSYFSKGEEFVKAISAGNFLLNTISEIKISESYFDSTIPNKYTALNKGTHHITLLPEVKLLTTPSIIIKNSFSFSSVEKILTRNITMNLGNLFTDKLQYPNITSAWASHFNFSNIATISVADFQNKLIDLGHKYELTRQSNFLLYLVYTLSALISITILSLMLYRFCSRPQPQPQPQQHEMQALVRQRTPRSRSRARSIFSTN